MRLDRMLSELNIATRKESKALVRAGRITVNGIPVRDASVHVCETDAVTVDGQPVHYTVFDYIMLHKPAGVITATEDTRQRTVLNLLEETPPQGAEAPVILRKGIAPVGRLDKDTTGLLLLTNDGALAHRLLAPGNHVDKTYAATVRGEVTAEDVRRFSEGLPVTEDWTAMPAQLVIRSIRAGSPSFSSRQAAGQERHRYRHDGPTDLIAQKNDAGEVLSDIEITIQEGKYHQIKRMFAAVGKEVLTLKRLSMGPLVLDPSLTEGRWRRLTAAELELLGTVPK